jgi:hypothetical protein
VASEITGVSQAGAMTTVPREVVDMLDHVFSEYSGPLDGNSIAVEALHALEAAGYVITNAGNLRANVDYKPGQVETADGKHVTVHSEASCDPQYACVIHRPSNHKMKEWPLVWRHDRYPTVMERLCKHAVGHPDPDGVAYNVRSFPDGHMSAVHGCDGCCKD